METSLNVLGFLNDAWFKYIVDFGNAGPDLGKGRKFLIVPPGDDGDLPEGYHVAKTTTYGNWVIWRGFQVGGSPKSAVDVTRKLSRMYPLSRKDTRNNWIQTDPSKRWHTILRLYGPQDPFYNKS